MVSKFMPWWLCCVIDQIKSHSANDLKAAMSKARGVTLPLYNKTFCFHVWNPKRGLNYQKRIGERAKKYP
ncbi:Uncharacterized protein TCM_023111 [Theobroma cacao]|uniref:Uncharacterized protein n=1 Tax=Theobroma cacao TaxID=3641 RepID=A0A061EV59_THECC|nr:Uncharacterized protein TCM_023111 [Theobroma cacao]